MCGPRHLLPVVFAVLLLCSFASAGTVAVSRLTTLDASGRTSDDSFDLTDSFTTFGPYDNTIGDSIAVPEGGTTRAEASQQSDVAAGPFGGFARGTAEAQVAEFDAIAAQAESSFEFVFDVTDVDETLRLVGTVGSTFDASARVAIFAQGDDDPLFARFVGVGEQDDLDFDDTVILNPGRYTLLGEGIVTGTPVPGSANFDVTFSTLVTNPIPLPAAAWAGSVGLVVAFMYARRMGRR